MVYMCVCVHVSICVCVCVCILYVCVYSVYVCVCMSVCMFIMTLTHTQCYLILCLCPVKDGSWGHRLSTTSLCQSQCQPALICPLSLSLSPSFSVFLFSISPF